jgi:hypothetical protein
MQSSWLGVVVFLALVAALLVIRWARTAIQPDVRTPRVEVLGVYSPILTWLRYRQLPAVQLTSDWARLRRHAIFSAELTVLTGWVLWVGRAYLDFDRTVWPLGNEWALNSQGYFALELIAQCGPCAFWNGFTNGGAPTFAQLLTAIGHPLAVGLIAMTGVIHGTKLLVVAGLVMAGWAQWWIGEVVGVSRWPRMWMAGMAVVGGHLAGRMQSAMVEELFSAAACALVLAPAFALATTGQRRFSVLLGVLLGLALLAGQAYMQMVTLVAILPASLLLLVERRPRWYLRPAWKDFVVAFVVAGLISAVLWIPVIHFWPNFEKPIDRNFTAVQPLWGQLLSLIISDQTVFEKRLINPIPFPAWYINYIGWVPVVLAGGGLVRAWHANRPLFVWAGVGVVLVFAWSSGLLLQGLALSLPEFAYSFRTPSVMASMAVPLILGLAGYGLDGLRTVNWAQFATRPTLARGLVTSIALILTSWAIFSAYGFGQQLMLLASRANQPYQIADRLRSFEADWVAVPFGESQFAFALNDQGFKVTGAIRPWRWRHRNDPDARVALHRQTANPNMDAAVIGSNLLIGSLPDAHYAMVEAGQSISPCRATAIGGNIDVYCDTISSGILTVQENQWVGWLAWRDGQSVNLREGHGLSVDAPAGAHYYTFRYQPWDVPLGLALSLAGLIAAGVLWFRK